MLNRQMPEIRPFRGLRYTADAGKLDDLVAPPYDVMSSSEREDYASRNPYNIVHLTLPEHQADDRSKFVKYARSAALLAEWRREGLVAPEGQPAFYRYTQGFKGDGIDHQLKRTALITLIKVEPYEKGIVLPHEQTFPKHKEDRLRILEATRSHLECIFGLYEDPNGKIDSAVKSAEVGGVVEVRNEIGSSHKLEPIVDKETINALKQVLTDRKVWIADGHHRYETALTFRQMLGDKPGPVAEDYMMMALTSMSDPGLILLPTHRIVHGLTMQPEDLKERLAGQFHIEEVHSTRLWPALDSAHKQGKRAFGIAMEGGHGFVLNPIDFDRLAKMEGAGSESLRSLDVSVLHKVILEQLLGVTNPDSIAYTRDPREAERAANQGGTISFLMNPPSVEDMRTIALGGEKMPQKSTYYFPKILSGLVLWSLGDFE
jgi:uncharacterized protein (DUF1015 family)